VELPLTARRRLIPLACALAAAALAGIAVTVSLREQGWDTTALVRMHHTLPLAQLALQDDPAFRLRGGSGFYDGAFFYAIARDPVATGEAHRLLREAPYYWGHPAYGWFAWLASGGGKPGAVPDALLAVGLIAILVAGGAASVLASSLGWTPWGGLAVAINPGLVLAVSADTSEAVGAAFVLVGLGAYARGRRAWAIVCFAALCLVKEPLALVPLALGAWEIWRRRRPPVVAAAVLPALAWWLYLRIHLGAFPFGQGRERLTAPLTGWVHGLVGAASQSWNPGVDTAQLGEAAVPLITVAGLAIIVGFLFALRLRSFLDPPFLALVALYACITPNGVQYPKDLIRELALVLTLLPFVLVARPRSATPLFARTDPPAPPSSGRRRES
jgi:hypothetical protein